MQCVKNQSPPPPPPPARNKGQARRPEGRVGENCCYASASGCREARRRAFGFHLGEMSLEEGLRLRAANNAVLDRWASAAAGVREEPESVRVVAVEGVSPVGDLLCTGMSGRLSKFRLLILDGGERFSNTLSMLLSRSRASPSKFVSPSNRSVKLFQNSTMNFIFIWTYLTKRYKTSPERIELNQ